MVITLTVMLLESIENDTEVSLPIVLLDFMIHIQWCVPKFQCEVFALYIAKIWAWASRVV